jgi:hypothetical protein
MVNPICWKVPNVDPITVHAARLRTGSGRGSKRGSDGVGWVMREGQRGRIRRYVWEGRGGIGRAFAIVLPASDLAPVVGPGSPENTGGLLSYTCKCGKRQYGRVRSTSPSENGSTTQLTFTAKLVLDRMVRVLDRMVRVLDRMVRVLDRMVRSYE